MLNYCKKKHEAGYACEILRKVIKLVTFVHGIPISVFFAISAVPSNLVVKDNMEKRCMDGVTYVVFVCPVLPAYCHPYT